MRTKSRIRKKSMARGHVGDREPTTSNLLPKVCHYCNWVGQCSRQSSTEVENQHHKDDNSVSYRVYETLHIQRCVTCESRECERYPLGYLQKQDHEHTDEHPRINTKPSTCSDCIKCRNISKSKMIRIAGQCVIFILFILCSVYVFGQYTNKDTSKIVLGGPKNLIMSDYLRPVSLHQFRQQVKNARSHIDIYRIFSKDKRASDKKIYDILDGENLLNIAKRRSDDYQYDMDTYDYIQDSPDYSDNGYDHKLASQAFQHYDEVFNSQIGQCREPRPEIVRVPSDGLKLYFPDYTILHRCRNVSGCCWDDKQECGVKSHTTVVRPFLVLALNPNGDVFPDGTQSVTTKLFQNHTECECKDLTPLPSCEKFCPYPFKMRRPAGECICDCDEDTPNCLDIKQGRTQLGEEEYECVKAKRCIIPTCQKGEFIMEKNFCPTLPRAHYSYHVLPGQEIVSKHKHRHNHGNDGHRRKHHKHRTNKY